jgi:hypothetical protein
MREQVRHLTRMCAYHHSHCVTGYSNRVGDDNVERRPTRQLHQLLGLAEAPGGSRGEN